FFFHHSATPYIYTLSLPDALPIYRCRPVAARERQPVREGQRLDLARSLPPRPRRRLPREQADQAADGRARLPSVPEPEQRSAPRSEEHTSELQSRSDLVCRLLLEK